MRLSARNIIKGKILEVKLGTTTAHVRIDVGGGSVITSSITNEAVEELGLKAGDAAYAVIKASDVMVGQGLRVIGGGAGAPGRGLAAPARGACARGRHAQRHRLRRPARGGARARRARLRGGRAGQHLSLHARAREDARLDPAAQPRRAGLRADALRGAARARPAHRPRQHRQRGGGAAARPDVIFDYGSLTATYRSLADRAQQQTGVPYLLFDGSVSAIPAAYARARASCSTSATAAASLARPRGAPARRDRPARRAGARREAAARLLRARAERARDRGRAAPSTPRASSALGARNVARAPASGGRRHGVARAGAGLGPRDDRHHRSAPSSRRCAPIRSGGRCRRSGTGACTSRRRLPFRLGRLPAVGEPADRAALARALFYPEQFPEDLATAARDFYTLFYHRAPTERAARRAAGRARAAAPLTVTAPVVAPARGRAALGCLLALGALAVLVLVAFAVGRYPVAPGRALGACSGPSSPARRPRAGRGRDGVLAACAGRACCAARCVGAALAAAGAAYQGLFRNPLVSPDILGVSAGAALGAVLGIFLSLPVAGIQGLAFALRARPRWRWSTRSAPRCAATIRCWCWCSPAS